MQPIPLWLATDLPGLPAGTPGEGYVNGPRAAFRPKGRGVFTIPAAYVTTVKPPPVDRITERLFGRRGVDL